MRKGGLKRSWDGKMNESQKAKSSGSNSVCESITVTMHSMARSAVGVCREVQQAVLPQSW